MLRAAAAALRQCWHVSLIMDGQTERDGEDDDGSWGAPPSAAVGYQDVSWCGIQRVCRSLLATLGGSWER